MENIPTAKDFLCEITDFSPEHCDMPGTIDYQVVEKLKQFAKIHIQAALKAAAKDARTYTRGASDGWECWEVTGIDENSILRAYPEDNVK